MKFLRVAVVTSCLLFSALMSCGQDKKGFDIAQCDPEAFHPGHFSVIGKDLKLDKISPGPDKVVDVPDGPLYQFVSEDDKHRKLYVYVNKAGDKYQLVIREDAGIFSVNGEIQGVLFIVEDADGSKLAENAKQQFKSCVDLVNAETNADKS